MDRYRAITTSQLFGLGCCFIMCTAASHGVVFAADQPKGSSYQAQAGSKLRTGLTYGTIVAPVRLIQAPITKWGHPGAIAREVLCSGMMLGFAAIDVLTFPIPGQGLLSSSC